MIHYVRTFDVAVSVALSSSDQHAAGASTSQNGPGDRTELLVVNPAQTARPGIVMMVYSWQE